MNWAGGKIPVYRLSTYVYRRMVQKSIHHKSLLQSLRRVGQIQKCKVARHGQIRTVFIVHVNSFADPIIQWHVEHIQAKQMFGSFTHWQTNSNSFRIYKTSTSTSTWVQRPNHALGCSTSCSAPQVQCLALCIPVAQCATLFAADLWKFLTHACAFCTCTTNRFQWWHQAKFHWTQQFAWVSQKNKTRDLVEANPTTNR